MAHMTEHLKQNSTIVGSVSEALLLDYFETLGSRSSFFHFDSWNWWLYWSNILVYLLLACVIAYLVCQHRRARPALAAAVAGSAIPMRVLAYDITLPPYPSTTSVSDNMFNDSYFLIVTLWIPYVIFPILLLLLIYATYRLLIYFNNDMHSFVALAFEIPTATVYIRIHKLLDGGRNYVLNIPHISQPRWYLYFFGLLWIDTSNWHITHTTSGKILKLPKWILVGTTNTSRLDRFIIPFDWTVTVLTVHSHQVEFGPLEPVEGRRVHVVDNVDVTVV